MLKKQDERLGEGKKTSYLFHSQHVSDEKLDRWREKLAKDLEEHSNSPAAYRFTKTHQKAC
jgi:hypothetical protein